MTLDEAHALLAANEVAAEGSFLFSLYEQEEFERERFWDLSKAAVVIGASDAGDGQELRQRAFHVYNSIVRLVIWHYSPHDQCTIKGMPGRDLPEYVEQLERAFRPLILGRVNQLRDAPLPSEKLQHAILERSFEQSGRSSRS